MIRALSLELSGRHGSVALSCDELIIGESVFSHGLRHAAGLMPMIDQLTRQHGWGPRDIDHIYVSIGPGSFTGLRIAVTLAKMLAMATEAKIVAVPTMRVVLENLPPNAREAIVVFDAKRDQIFTARYMRADGPWSEVEPVHVDTLAAAMARAGRPVHVIGEGIPYHRQFLPNDSPEKSGVIVTPESSWPGRAAAVATIGGAMAAEGDFADAMDLRPLYVRVPDAEEKRLAAEVASA